MTSARSLRRRRAAAATLTITLLSLVGVGTTSPVAVHAEPPQPYVPCVQNVCLIVVDQLADSDGDGFADIDEKAYGSNPHDAASHPPVLDVIDGVLNGTTPSFTEHMTELVVLPVLGSNLDTVMTGLGNFSLSGKSREEKLGLTLHQQYGIDADFNGLRIDLGQTLSASGSSKPFDRWSLVAAGGKKGSGPDSTQVTFNEDGSTDGRIVSTDRSGTTLTKIHAVDVGDGSRISEQTSQSATVGKDGGVSASGPTTTKDTIQSGSRDGSGASHSSSSITVRDENGRQTSYINVDTTRNSDGSSVSEIIINETHPDGSSSGTIGTINRDASGNVTSASWKTTNYDANGKETGGSGGSCTNECVFDPDLEMAMGWAGPLTSEDWARVKVKLGSTIHTADGWTPPLADAGPTWTSVRNGPLVALLDPDSALTVIAAGAPTFTSAQPDYDPRLQDMVDEVTRGGQLPPGSSPYQQDDP